MEITKSINRLKILASSSQEKIKTVMINQHSCPCCSQPLLRHISYKKIYWFCSQCHQEMPDIENIVKTKLESQHWISSQMTQPSQLEERWQETEKLFI
jgi:ribosomal protein L37AE/L43A